ncbi:MFS transporter [Solwaraspora sp. WMMD791]|uniref:MFS transporter n=1 Tax=Solwaraspora sp. WMMD791 TaxID=3016086 RepID=UPI00249BD6F0|nr:MFS transporter [Solwaraspora sp. WMMD791]WFE30250.1 MFS transporter [Solwaraspora sp. WMMD791]
MASPLAVLTGNRDFRRLLSAELVMFGADWFVMVPLLVLLPELTGSGVWGALVLAADTGIHALMLPFTGTLADRFDRRRILILANLAAVVAVLLLLGVRSSGTAWLALAAVAALAVAKSCYSPAAQAALPNVVSAEELPAANVFAGSAWGTMAIVGASAGGLVSAAVGPYACFWIAAAALMVAAGFTATIRRPMQAPRDSSEPALRTLAAIRETLVYIGRRPQVLALVTAKSAVGLGNGVLTLFPLLAGVYGVGAIGTGLLFAVRGAGAVVGPLLMRPVLNRRRWLLTALAASMSVYGLSYTGIALISWFPLVLALVFLAHLGGGSNWVLSNYALQAVVPDRLRGRVFAADLMLATLAISVSQLVVASVIDTVDIRVILAGCGLVTVTYAIGWWLVTRRLPLAVAAADTR